MLVLPSDKTRYTCFHYQRMSMLQVLRIRILPHKRMLQRNAIELMKSRQNYGTIVLGHISRGRIERLVKASILPPLEFSELEQYIDCIKENLLRNKRTIGNIG